jgi:predicted metal-binding membrane protein
MLQHAHGAPSIVALAIAWTGMMAIMMAPTAAPWVRAFHRFSPAPRPVAARVGGTVLFGAGYLVVWAAFGIAVAIGQTVVHVPASAGPFLLVGAGLFQLSPLKQACLSHCRNPFSFLLARWKDGPASALHLGLAHGVYCLGCCWALMLTALAAGLMNLWWMAILTVVTFVEQVSPWGARLRVPIGIALGLAGIAGMLT